MLQQERGGQFDTMKFPTLENQLLDIMRTASLEQQHESYKSELFVFILLCSGEDYKNTVCVSLYVYMCVTVLKYFF